MTERHVRGLVVDVGTADARVSDPKEHFIALKIGFLGGVLPDSTILGAFEHGILNSYGWAS